VADCLEQPPHLTILPLPQLDRQMRLTGRRLAQHSRVCLQTIDPRHEARERGFIHSAADRHDVYARNSVRWIGDPVGETRVSGEQQ